jgi:hypothetical protein
MTAKLAHARIILPLAAAALLSACTTGFEARVSRFQQMPAAQGNSFVIEPRDKAMSGGLEFATYANLVKQKLIAAGFQEASSPEAAALTVQLDYHVTPPREKVQTRPGVGFGRWGFGGWGGWGGWAPHWGAGWGGWGGWGPGFGGWGGWGANDVYSVTQYNAIVAMRINRTGDKQSVFEGRAETVSSSNNLTKLVPNLVTAMFANFPGSSGETVRVRFDPAKPGVAPTVKPLG